MQSPHEQRKISHGSATDAVPRAARATGGTDLSQERQTPRAATRAPLGKPIKLQFDDSIDVAGALCENISIGGMQVLTEEGRPQGTRVRFEVEIEEGVTIRGLGEVVWTRKQSAPGHEPGMGIKFRFLEQRDRQAIFKLVSEHIKERLAEKHPSLDDAAAAPPPGPATAATGPQLEPGPAPSARPPATSSFGEAGLELGTDSGPSLSDFTAGDDPGWLDEEPEPSGTHLSGTHPALAQTELGGSEAEDFYRPRPAQRRAVPIVPIAVLLLVGGIVVVYLYWDRLFGPPAPPSLGQAAEVSAGESPGLSAPPPSAPEPNAAPPIDEPPPFSVESPPEPAAAPPVEAPPRSPPASPPPRAQRQFSRVLDVKWVRQPGGGRVEIETDGAIPESRYRHFRLEGDNPREVVRLQGVTERVATREIPITGAAVSKIRIGYHENRELHVVLDMRDRSSRLVRIRRQGNKLILIVE